MVRGIDVVCVVDHLQTEELLEEVLDMFVEYCEVDYLSTVAGNECKSRWRGRRSKKNVVNN